MLRRLLIFAVPLFTRAADSPLRFNKLFGGSGGEIVTAITTDRSGFVIAAGATSSYDFPVTDGSRNTATHFASTIDAGASWSLLGNLPAGVPVSIAIDTSTPPVWYATGTNGIFKSIDEGASWTETGPHLPGCNNGCFSGLTINPAQPSILYLRAYNGILKSTNAGATWVRLPPPTDNPNLISYVVLDPFQPDHLFTAVNTHNYRSFDGGATWNQITESAPNPQDFCGSGVAFDAVTPGLAYLSDHCDLFRSTDGGVCWQVLTTPFPRSPTTAVAHPTQAGSLYVIATLALYVTHDSGDSWTPLYNYGSGNGPHSLAVDPRHPDIMLTSGARSSDGGVTWQSLGLGRTADAFVFDPAHPGRAIVSTTGASAGFLARLDSAGTILAATYLGGQGGAAIVGVATDADGNIYVAGTTRSFDFPITAGAYQATMPTDGTDGFAARFDPDLHLIYATFVPGNAQVTSIAVDPAGNAVIGGWSPSPGRCGTTKLTPDGTAAIFAAQVGTGNGDTCAAVASDPDGNTIVAGSSLGDAFLAKLDSAGSVVYSKRLGGSGRDDAFSIAVDDGGNIYIAGATASTNFPVTGGAYQNTLGTVCALGTGGGGFLGPGIGIPINQAGFVAKLDPAGTPLYSTYLGTGCDSARNIALDAAGDVWLAGATGSLQYPQVMAFESGPPQGSQKAVVTMLNSSGAAIGFSSFLGGANVIHVDRFGNVYVGGSAGGHASVAKIQTQYQAALTIRTVGNAFGRRNGPVSPGQITLIAADGLAPQAPQDLTLSPSGALPRTLPALANEYIVISAHLDGYGIGEPWGADNIYNGAFDDAAYAATLIDFAESLKAARKTLKRPVLFAVWTGEEKGLLGSRYYVAHPTLPGERFVANVNLDQLRPIFPLKLLTTLAVDDSTMGDTVRQVAGGMDIRIQADPEPGRNLLRRSDHWNFMQIGVPAVGFIFGYEPGSPEEKIYREWYAYRYHSPKDDLEQPWDPAAAAKFNDFFGKVVESLANAAEKPHWKPGSPYAPK